MLEVIKNNHITRMLLWPVLWARRIIVKWRSRPVAVVQTLFAYDSRRFVQFAGCFKVDSRGAAEARIIMAYHVLEKGLTMPHRRLGFGRAAVLELMKLISDFEFQFGKDCPQVKHAIGCIKEYLFVHQQMHFDMSKDCLFWDAVTRFCAVHDEVARSCQIEVGRERFFANNEAPFPLFAASRHTLRYYEGVVDIHRVRSAVGLAMTAPSACNRQFVKVYCVSDHKKRDAMLSLQNGNRGFGSKADKLLVVTADMSGNRWAEERNDLYTNAGIFTMNLCYALQYNKIAHCILNWSVSPENDILGHELLSIPKNEVIALLLSCGNAPSHFMLAASPRREIDEIFSEIK